jgi:hypothetical protein
VRATRRTLRGVSSTRRVGVIVRGSRDDGRIATTFLAWLADQTHRRDAVGDLARDTRMDPRWPPRGKISRARLARYLESRDAVPGALAALHHAWDEWDADRRATS